MPRYFHDDNYGAYEVGPEDDPDELREFYEHTERMSVKKRCEGCNRMVKIRRDYAYCNSCADKLERGGDLG